MTTVEPAKTTALPAVPTANAIESSIAMPSRAEQPSQGRNQLEGGFRILRGALDTLAA